MADLIVEGNIDADTLREIDSPNWLESSWDDWTHYIPLEVQEFWPKLSREAKVVAYLVADAIATKELDHW